MVPKTRNNSIAVVIGLSINALNIIRSLGRKSIDVIAIHSNTSEYAARSRYCRVICCEKIDGEILIEKLINIGRSLKQKKVLFCTSDLSVLTVSKYRSELEEYYHFVLPPNKTVEMLMNKKLFYEFAFKIENFSSAFFFIFSLYFLLNSLLTNKFLILSNLDLKWL